MCSSAVTVAEEMDRKIAQLRKDARAWRHLALSTDEPGGVAAHALDERLWELADAAVR